MRKCKAVAAQTELRPLLELTQRVGSEPLLTQGSSGNSSEKLEGTLWIKASGRWMADAMRDDIFIPLDLNAVKECLGLGLDPAGQYPRASVETAMHAVLPHRVVLHVHCVNTIAWAVRSDGPIQLQRRLNGLAWQWVPYLASGVPLSRGVEDALSARADTNVFVLGNHGLVIAGEDAKAVENMLAEVRRRLCIPAREAHPADYAVLAEVCRDSTWDLPDDDQAHALGTDVTSQQILAGGVLHPCQAVFFDSDVHEPFQAIPYVDSREAWQSRYSNRSFLIIQGRGIVVNRSMAPAKRAMLSGLAQVMQRLDASAPLRYLNEAEVEEISQQVEYRYQELPGVSQAGSER